MLFFESTFHCHGINFLDAFSMTTTSSIAVCLLRNVFAYIFLNLLWEDSYMPAWRYSMPSTCFNASHKWSSACHFCVNRPDGWYVEKLFWATILKLTIRDQTRSHDSSFQHVSCPLLNANLTKSTRRVNVSVTSVDFVFLQKATTRASMSGKTLSIES